MKTQPIHVGDQFKMRSGSVWKVIRTRPGGIVELFNEAECHFTDRYHREVITWDRCPANRSPSETFP